MLDEFIIEYNLVFSSIYNAKQIPITRINYYITIHNSYSCPLL